MKWHTCLLAGALGLAIVTSALAAEVGTPVSVAPKAEGTRLQILADAAWSGGAKCWLVAWREGYINEDASDIWCARISADGKALDPAGVRLTSGPGFKSRPAVASDGKDFLVVWEDFRNGKDWDVYGARVSGKGKALDKKAFLLAGGAHNQCRPTVAFAKGSYLAAWMGFTKSYGIYGARVSPAGKVLDSTPLPLAPRDDAKQHVITPALTSNGDILMAAMAPTARDKGRSYVAVSPVDVTNGKLLSPPGPATTRVRSRISNLHGVPSRSPAIAADKTGALVIINGVKASRSLLHVFRADLSGKITGELNIASVFCDRQAIAFDGEKYLLVADGVEESRKKGKPPVAQIRGWHVAPGGKPGQRFVVSGGTSSQCLSPAAAAGPKGSVLVVYSKVRGNDDTKLVARVVK